MKDHYSNRSDIDNVELSPKKSKNKKAKTKCIKKKNKKESTVSTTIDEQTDSDIEDNLCSSIENTESTEFNVEAWSIMGVPPVIIKALADQNFHSPTIIQAKTLPAAILGNRDILGAAETGSGKTLAFGIPIIKGILELKSQQTRTAVSKKSISYNSRNKGTSDKKETEGNIMFSWQQKMNSFYFSWN